VRKDVEGPPLEAVDRALRLVVLLRQRGCLSVTVAAEHLEVAPSTAHRLLSALCYRDFAVQDRDRRYRLGPQLVESGSAALSRAALRRLARPALDQLLERTGETSHLTVLAGADVVFIDGAECEQSLRIGLRTGIRMPAYCASGGKAMLAALPKAEVDRLHPKGLPPWPNAHTPNMAALHRQLAAVRKQGYAFNHEESEQGVVAVGSGLLDQARRPVAAISVSIPSARFRRSDVCQHVDAVLAATSACQEQLDAVVGSA
jgi:IclR family transcriptional regulator, acetate operon repressor